MPVSSADINAYIKSILENNALTDAERADAINKQAAKYEVSQDQISAATGFTPDIVSKYLGGANPYTLVSGERGENAIVGREGLDYLGNPAFVRSDGTYMTRGYSPENINQSGATVNRTVTNQDGQTTRFFNDGSQTVYDPSGKLVFSYDEYGRQIDAQGNTMYDPVTKETLYRPDIQLNRSTPGTPTQPTAPTQPVAPTQPAAPVGATPVAPPPVAPDPTIGMVRPTPGATGGLPGATSPIAPVTPITTDAQVPEIKLNTGIMTPLDTDYDKWLRKQREYLGGITLPKYQRPDYSSLMERYNQQPAQQIKPQGYAKGGLHELNQKYAPPGMTSMADELSMGLDLSRVSPEQLAQLEAEDPSALSRGVQRFERNKEAAQMGPVRPAADARAMLEATAEQSSVKDLLGRYLNQPSQYGEELGAARKRREEAQAKLEEMILKSTQQQGEVGPSKAEMYFNLAAALSQPTKTGHFMESMGNAAGAMSKHQAETRKAEQEARSGRQKAQMTLAEMQAKYAGEDVDTLRQLASGEMTERRGMVTELLKDQLKSGQPQSEAGKAAKDAGLTPGTPEFSAYVDKYLRNKLEGDPIRNLTATIASGQFDLAKERDKRAAEKAELDKAERAKLTPAELKLKIDTEDTLSAVKSSYDTIKEALKINPNTYDASYIDSAQYAIMKKTGWPDDKTKNTEYLEKLLKEQAIGQLRAVFGGSPTEGERAFLLELQGMDLSSVKSREQVLNRAKTLLLEKYRREKSRLADINAGKIRLTTPESLPKDLEE